MELKRNELLEEKKIFLSLQLNQRVVLETYLTVQSQTEEENENVFAG